MVDREEEFVSCLIEPSGGLIIADALGRLIQLLEGDTGLEKALGVGQ